MHLHLLAPQLPAVCCVKRSLDPRVRKTHVFDYWMMMRLNVFWEIYVLLLIMAH